MEVSIRGAPKEIAAFVLEIQGRWTQTVKLSIDSKEFGREFHRNAEPPVAAIQKAVQTAA